VRRFHTNHVMKKYLAVWMALFLTLGLHARIHKAWSYAELNDQATFIVIATPTKVTTTSERTALPNIQTVHKDGTKEDVMGAGVETTFEVLTVLKGERGTNALVLHHFTLADPKPMNRGPQLVSFEPKDKKRYLMFLQRESDGRFAAVCGQTDPVYAIKELGTYP
jgi:hypothetical protein